jgi:hypothetical protein
VAFGGSRNSFSSPSGDESSKAIRDVAVNGASHSPPETRASQLRREIAIIIALSDGSASSHATPDAAKQEQYPQNVGNVDSSHGQVLFSTPITKRVATKR